MSFRRNTGFFQPFRIALCAAFILSVVVPVRADDSSIDRTKQAKLMHAVEQGDAPAVKQLLADKTFHPLFRGWHCGENTMCNLATYAVNEKGSVEVIRALHDVGVPIDEPDGGTGDTPIIRALLAGRVDLAECLAQLGANPVKPNKFGVTPFIVASSEGSPALLEIMIKAGAPVDLKQKLPDVLAAGESPNNLVGGITPLMMAANAGRLDMVETLLKLGANPELLDEKGRNVYTYAMFGKDPKIQPQLTELITKYSSK